jgi:hypothetical protein
MFVRVVFRDLNRARREAPPGGLCLESGESDGTNASEEKVD